MLADANPVRRSSDDRLGRSPFARALAGIIGDRANDGLVVIGIEGAWGTGKSSVLQLTAEQLTVDHRNRVVLVSAWRTSNQDQFLANLSYSMATALRRDWQYSFFRVAWAKLRRQSLPMLLAIFVPALTLVALAVFPNVRGWTRGIVDADPKKLAESIGLFGLPLLGIIFSKLSQPVLERLRSLAGSTSMDSIGAMERFAFEFDVLGAAQPRGTRFLVLVEDLDRCPPAQVSGVLSAIAQLSAHPKADRIAFLLAYDREILLKSIHQDAVKHLVDDKSDLSVAEDYLDRIVNLELPLPEPVEGGASLQKRRRRWLPAPAVLRALLISLAIVSFGVARLAGERTSNWAAWLVLAVIFMLGVEALVLWARRLHKKDGIPNDWDEAVAHAKPWMEDLDLRARARILNRARAALLLRPDAGLTSFEAVTVAAFASRWPDSFNRERLAASRGHPLDIRSAFQNRDVTEAVERMQSAGLPIDQFKSAEKQHAVVSAFRR